MRRGRLVRIAGWFSLIMVLQGAALWFFRAREASKRTAKPFEMTRLDGREQMPKLAVERRDGTRAELGPTGPRLVHFWASWCAPCRDEMPVFAELAVELRESGIDVVAVSVDDGWAAIEKFFDGDVPSFVVRAAEPDVLRQFGAGPLPDSFLVSSSGALIGRIHGGRNWSNAGDVIRAECSKRK